MTDDQQFILALVGVISTNVIQVVTLLRVNSTHHLVNGLQAGKARRARAQGHAAGVKAERLARTRRVSDQEPRLE